MIETTARLLLSKLQATEPEPIIIYSRHDCLRVETRATLIIQTSFRLSQTNNLQNLQISNNPERIQYIFRIL